jgi:hypothetical protein
MSTGTLEKDLTGIKNTEAILRARNYAGFHQEFLIFDGETHLSVVDPAFMKGVKSIFASGLAR